MNVIIVGGNRSYHDMFKSRGWTTDEQLPPDLVCFTGGEDVDPALYDEVLHPFSSISKERDKRDMDVFNLVDEDVPLVGICRGGQFLNVMCGGKLYQHVNGHATGRPHKAYTDDGREVMVTSTHHQMMIPAVGGEVLAWAKESTLVETADFQTVREERDKDIEVVLYRDAGCLCFQPHPEFPNSGCADYFFECLKRLLEIK